jgi:hypothetical protein
MCLDVQHQINKCVIYTMHAIFKNHVVELAFEEIYLCTLIQHVVPDEDYIFPFL